MHEGLCAYASRPVAFFARYVRRHRIAHAVILTSVALAVLCAVVTQYGVKFLVDPAYRLPQLNTVRIPEGLEDKSARRRLLDEFGIEVGAGLGKFAGKFWRIGLMGSSATANHVNVLLSALRTIR